MRNLAFTVINLCCDLVLTSLIMACVCLVITNPVLGLSQNGLMLLIAVLAIPAIFLAMFLGHAPACWIYDLIFKD